MKHLALATALLLGVALGLLLTDWKPSIDLRVITEQHSVTRNVYPRSMFIDCWERPNTCLRETEQDNDEPMAWRVEP